MSKDSPRNVNSFRAMKAAGSRISMVTAYDCAMARCAAASEIDLILVGDSLGMVVLGYENTLRVSMADMVHHTAAVRRGAPEAFIIADLPFLSYHLGPEETKRNAADLIVKGGANAVKLEGGSPARMDAVKAILDCEIPVCAHIGLTPQSIHRFGGYKVQGKTPEEHQVLIKQALALEKAGAFMLVLEGVPELLGKEITEAVGIPTVGIGAGRFTDGQVLVWHDLLGYEARPPKFVKAYAGMREEAVNALNRYAAEVRSGEFPAADQVYYPIIK
jgi:3-methyl-2-oxobutanoate hydroxymethyltransferase